MVKTRTGDHDDFGVCLELSYLADDRVVIEFGHFDVCYDEIGPFARERVDTFSAVRRFGHLVPGRLESF
mgnify:CR=1 FL=1